MVGVDGNPIAIEIPVVIDVDVEGKEPVVIDEEFKQELLSRASNAKAQEERIYKSEGLRVDRDARTGAVIVTRKM